MCAGRASAPLSTRVHHSFAVFHHASGMAVSVPMINDPRGQRLEVLPFAHEHARLQCNNAISRAFEATGENTSAQVMLHLNARDGVKLLEMVANVVRGDSESDVLVVVMGREVDPALAGLLHHEEDGSVAESELLGAVNEESSDISSLTTPSLVRGRGDELGLPEVERLEPRSRGVVTHTTFATNWDIGWMARRMASSAAYRSVGSESSWMTPSSDIMPPPIRRAEAFVNLRHENEKIRYWSSAATKLQRPWRRRRADIMNPRSVTSAFEAMRKSAGMSPEGHGHIACLIAEYMTGVPSAPWQLSSPSPAIAIAE